MQNDPLVLFEQLAKQARRESSSLTDVAGDVLATLKSARMTATPHQGTDLMFVIGSLAAALLGIALFVASLQGDSLSSIMQPFVSVLE